MEVETVLTSYNAVRSVSVHQDPVVKAFLTLSGTPFSIRHQHVSRSWVQLIASLRYRASNTCPFSQVLVTLQ